MHMTKKKDPTQGIGIKTIVVVTGLVSKNVTFIALLL